MHARADSAPVSKLDEAWVARLRWAMGTWVPAMVLIALAVASGAWLANLAKHEPTRAKVSGHAPDVTMEEFEVVEMGGNGTPLRRLSAAYMAHFAETETKELTHPHLVIYKEDAEPWHVVSRRGWVSADNDELMLLGEVDIWRNYPNGKREVHIETEDLRVLPNDEFAETELPVTISTPETLTRGTGMRAYLGEGRVELLSNVKTTIQPVDH